MEHIAENFYLIIYLWYLSTSVLVALSHFWWVYDILLYGFTKICLAKNVGYIKFFTNTINAKINVHVYISLYTVWVLL